MAEEQVEVSKKDLRKLSLVLLAIIFLYEFDWFATHFEVSRGIATEANVLINNMGGISSGKVALFKALVLLGFVLTMGEIGRKKKRFRKVYISSLVVVTWYSLVAILHITILSIAASLSLI